MKFFVNDGVEIDLTPDVSKQVVVVNETTFWHNKREYTVKPIEFKIDDVYFMFAEMLRQNPNKKMFIHHFEPLANDFYAIWMAIEN